MHLAKATNGEAEKLGAGAQTPTLSSAASLTSPAQPEGSPGGGAAHPEPESQGSGGFRRRRTLPAEGPSRGGTVPWHPVGRGKRGAAAMDDHSLDEFRRRWQEELAQAQALRKRRRPEAAERRPRRPEVVAK